MPKSNKESVCPITKCSHIIGDIWNILIIKEILAGSNKFNDLHNSIEGISKSVLSGRLKKLENMEIVARTIINERPISIRYTLTKKGKALVSMIDEMKKYGQKYL